MGGCLSSAEHKNAPSNLAPLPPPFVPNSPNPNQPKGFVGGATMALPYAHVDDILRALAGQAEGFGRHAIGGLHGSVYCVTTLAGTASTLTCYAVRVQCLLSHSVLFGLKESEGGVMYNHGFKFCNLFSPLLSVKFVPSYHNFRAAWFEGLGGCRCILLRNFTLNVWFHCS